MKTQCRLWFWEFQESKTILGYCRLLQVCRSPFNQWIQNSWAAELSTAWAAPLCARCTSAGDAACCKIVNHFVMFFCHFVSSWAESINSNNRITQHSIVHHFAAEAPARGREASLALRQLWRFPRSAVPKPCRITVVKGAVIARAVF